MNGRGQYGDCGRSLYGCATLRTKIGLSFESIKAELERRQGEVRSFQEKIAAQKEELERLNGEVRSLQEEIVAQKAEMAMQGQLLQSPFQVFSQKRWTPLVRSWSYFYDDLKSASDASWRASAKVIEKALSDWRGRLIDARGDARGAGLKIDGSRLPGAPISTAPSPERPADQTVPSDKEKDSNVGLYVALGIGAVAMVAAAITFRHVEAA